MLVCEAGGRCLVRIEASHDAQHVCVACSHAFFYVLPQHWRGGAVAGTCLASALYSMFAEVNLCLD